MTSEGLLFTAVHCTLTAHRFRPAYANAGRNLLSLNVGYLNSELSTDGQNQKVPTFVSITEGDGIRLSDLKVTGYDDIEGGCCWGNVSIAMIGKSGACKKQGSMRVEYFWFDEEEAYEPGWYDIGENPLKDDESVLGNADEIIFDVGQGFVVYCDSDYIGCTIDSAGQVFMAQLSYPLSTDGQNYVGNPNPIPVKLSDLTVSGYDDIEGGCCWGNVSIAMIGKSGACKKNGSMRVEYFWFDEEDAYEAGWYDIGENPLKDDESILGNANEIVFNPGQGLVVYCDSDYVGSMINFPAVKLGE